MDFFQAQDSAIRKTKRLVFYYFVAVVLIIVAVYFAVTAGEFVYHQQVRSAGDPDVWQQVSLWDPMRCLGSLAGVVLFVGLGSLYKVFALREGGSAVARSLGGERVDRSTQNPKRKQLLNVVEEMAIASGVPVPEVFILTQESSINAFAAGWGRDDAVVAVSAGALDQLSRDELQGVIAHEYSHILHGDCRLNIRLMGVLFGIMMLSIFGRVVWALFRGTGRGRGVVIMSSGRRGGGRRGGGGKGGGGGALIIAVILVIVLVTIIGYIGTFFARLIQAAISRQREFLADASAVQYTRNPEGIAGALKRVAVNPERSVLTHPHASEAAHMFFADGMKRSLSSVLATHPPLRKRIKKVQPGWDGKFPELKQTIRQDVSAPVDQPRAAAHQPDPGRFIQGMAILGAIGTMSNENIATARRIRTTIPDSLDAMMREPDGARQSVLALLLADNEADDAAQWAVLSETYSEKECVAIRETEDLIKGLPRESRLGIMELATATLSQSTDLNRERLFLIVDQLIQCDKRVSHYEFCLRRILRERLSRGSRQAAADTRVQYMELKPEVADAVSLLISVVAREVSTTWARPELFEKALIDKYLLVGKVKYLPPEEGGIEKLDEALDVLKVSAFAIRAQCLRAVSDCIKADGQLSPEEAETLRMISLSLDCPVPPLGI